MKSPLSFSDRCTLLRTVDVHSLSLRWSRELGINWLPPRGLSEIECWRDQETGFEFYVPEDVAGGTSLYSQLQKFPWYYMEDKWEFSNALSVIKSLPVGSQTLEVGVGQGAFLKKARDCGCEIIGIEPNPDAAHLAKKRSFNILETDLSSLQSDGIGRWDCICAFQVLEHFANPRQFLDPAVKLLKPGGLLLLSVPNAAVFRKLDPERKGLLDQPPHHMGYWDENVFRSLEKIMPLNLKSVYYEPLALYHLEWFFNSWVQNFSDSADQFTRRLVFNRLSIPLMKFFLRLGVRKLVRGHTLLVCLQKHW